MRQFSTQQVTQCDLDYGFLYNIARKLQHTVNAPWSNSGENDVSDGGSGREAYWLMLVPGADRTRLAQYAAELPRLQAVHGGRFLVLAPAPLIERFGHNGEAHSVMLSAFPSSTQLRAWWESQAHRRLASGFRGIAGTVAVALEAESGASDADAKAVAAFFGPGPSPALLEAEGARALALVRERSVLRLHGDWIHGDVALYGWSSSGDARRSLLNFSSGQRARGLLLPTLPGVRPPDRARAAA
ncbi:MAG: hypothetical protein AMXMBFR25_31770 [Lysobacterales bacterium]|nr:hypothetical protein [Xanthomonadales bacterium]